MLGLKEFPTFKQHLRDFLVATKQFADQNNADLYADEVAAAVSRSVTFWGEIGGNEAQAAGPLCADEAAAAVSQPGCLCMEDIRQSVVERKLSLFMPMRWLWG